jgi:hypothetical protein
MAKFLRRCLLAAVAAIVSTSLTGAASHADAPTEPEQAAVEEVPARLRIFDREVNTVLLPQLREQNPASRPLRRPKAHTLLQLDAPITETSDVMFRVQAKKKGFLFLEFRF